MHALRSVPRRSLTQVAWQLPKIRALPPPGVAAPGGTKEEACMRPDTISVALDPRTRAFYCHALEMLTRAGAPFLVGGAYAFARYTGIERHTKDLDIFVRPE